MFIPAFKGDCLLDNFLTGQERYILNANDAFSMYAPFGPAARSDEEEIQYQ